MRPELQSKLNDLKTYLTGVGRAAIVFSGYADSTLVAHVMSEACGRENVLAVSAATELHTEADRQHAIDVARALGVKHLPCRVDLFDYPNMVKNTAKRCYYCKKAIYQAMRSEAAKKDFTVLLEGHDSEETPGNRAGRQAAKEMGIPSPLEAVGITIGEALEIAAALNLPGHNRPPVSCLAARLPFGSPITRGKLAQVQKSEAALNELGYDARVRHHGDIARLEMRNPADITRAAQSDQAARIASLIREVGRFAFVTLDLEGYRRGGLQTLPQKDEENL
ncbi:MAG: ATP-dependent sacrificial sulfur transferase LarE [Clostridia bacterium]|nr:ATP-dependent sacrificial sulfur transferase LarE [Clostridia bacterium]